VIVLSDEFYKEIMARPIPAAFAKPSI